ncbi:MAG: toll/interleukin-1 receptor domain-containing protein [Flavobacteriaceae bacterium]|nr:toll/interleukin-1 receptor domain-containing protein [Flavobacteriaceae bacterium]
MPDNDKIYQRIARKLNVDQSECVLLLGPELSVNAAGVSAIDYFSALSEKNNVAHYFPNENLFGFVSKQAEEDARYEVVDFYENCANMELLQLIYRIKIPLIINVCPDRSLNDYFRRQLNNDFTQGYFSIREYHNNQEMPSPTKNNPVIYNLFGRVDSEQSLIITHSLLYETMDKLLQDHSLPENIERFLQKASCYIFLGFKYDSWQYQLACHKLRVKDKDLSSQVLSTPEYEEGHPVGFIMCNHFSVNFTPLSAAETLKQIIKNCNKNTLRKDNPLGDFSIYISYSWQRPRKAGTIDKETIVDWIEDDLKVNPKYKGLPQVFRDKSRVENGDSIAAFMNNLSNASMVVQVIGDDYLKSPFCLEEAMGIWNSEGGKNKALLLVAADVDLSTKGIADYKQYWKEKFEKEDDRIKNGNLTPIEQNQEREAHEFKRLVQIYNFIDGFLIELKDTVHIQLDLEKDLIIESAEVDWLDEDKRDALVTGLVNLVNRILIKD